MRHWARVSRAQRLRPGPNATWADTATAALCAYPKIARYRCAFLCLERTTHRRPLRRGRVRLGEGRQPRSHRSYNDARRPSPPMAAVRLNDPDVSSESVPRDFWGTAFCKVVVRRDFGNVHRRSSMPHSSLRPFAALGHEQSARVSICTRSFCPASGSCSRLCPRSKALGPRI